MHEKICLITEHTSDEKGVETLFIYYLIPRIACAFMKTVLFAIFQRRIDHKADDINMEKFRRTLF